MITALNSPTDSRFNCRVINFERPQLAQVNLLVRPLPMNDLRCNSLECRPDVNAQ